MAVKYEVQEIKNSKGGGKPQPFVRLRQGKALTADDLASRIEQSCSATKSDVIAVMAEMRHIIVEQLSMGNRFYLPEVGYLSLSAGSTPFDQKKNGKITGKDIYLKNIDFQPEKELLKEVRRNVSFEKAGNTTRSSEYTEDELWSKIEAYLESNRYVTRQSLMSNFGLSKYKASQWLTHFVAAGKLLQDGTPRHPLFFPVAGGDAKA